MTFEAASAAGLQSHLLAYESLIGTLTRQVLAQQEQLSDLRLAIDRSVSREASLVMPQNASIVAASEPSSVFTGRRPIGAMAESLVDSPPAAASASYRPPGPTLYSGGHSTAIHRGQSAPDTPVQHGAPVDDGAVLRVNRRDLERVMSDMFSSFAEELEDRLVNSLTDRVRRITKEHVMHSIEREMERALQRQANESLLSNSRAHHHHMDAEGRDGSYARPQRSQKTSDIQPRSASKHFSVDRRMGHHQVVSRHQTMSSSTSSSSSMTSACSSTAPHSTSIEKEYRGDASSFTAHSVASRKSSRSTLLTKQEERDERIETERRHRHRHHQHDKVDPPRFDAHRRPPAFQSSTTMMQPSQSASLPATPYSLDRDVDLLIKKFHELCTN